MMVVVAVVVAGLLFTVCAYDWRYMVFFFFFLFFLFLAGMVVFYVDREFII